MANKLAIDEIHLSNKRVLLRVDYDVPMKGTQVLSHGQIINSLETIRYALSHDAKAVILISHFGEPMGIKSMNYSLAPVAEELRKLLARDVTFLPDCVGPLVEYLCEDPKPGSVILLENLRFHVEEEGHVGNKLMAQHNNVKLFRQSLRRIGDVYVNDAFSTVGWDHSSVLAVGYELKVAGLSLKDNLKNALLRERDVFERPFIAIVGGYRIKEQINLINSLLKKVDELIIGGGMALTFLNVLEGMTIGKALKDREGEAMVPDIMKTAEKNNVKIHFPVDFVVGDRYSPDAQLRLANVFDGLRSSEISLDIGPETISCFKYILLKAKRILWNGAIGEFQWPVFQGGTLSLMHTIGYMKASGTVAIIGGIDMAFAVQKFNLEPHFTYVNASQNTGITSLEGKKYPGIAVLTDKSTPGKCRCVKVRSQEGSDKSKKKNRCVDVELMKA